MNIEIAIHIAANDEVQILTDQEKRKIYNKTFYEKHKQEVLQKCKEKINCELCGKSSTKSNLYKHQHSRNCINNGFVKKTKNDEIAELKQQLTLLETKLNQHISNT